MELMAQDGYTWTYRQCRDKLKKLKSDYRATGEHNERSGSNTKDQLRYHPNCTEDPSHSAAKQVNLHCSGKSPITGNNQGALNGVETHLPMAKQHKWGDNNLYQLTRQGIGCKEYVAVVPANVQKSVLIKEEAPEEQWPDVNQQDVNCLHIKEEEEEQWTSLGGEPLNVKEETDVTSFSFTTVPLKSEGDEEKPLFSQLHQHQDEVGDLLTSSSADHIESATGGGSCGGAETTKNPDLNSCEYNSDSSETEVSEDDDDVNNPDSHEKHLSDCRSKTEDTDKDWESFPSSIPELDGNAVDKNGQKPFFCDLCDRRFTRKDNLNKHMIIHTGQKPFSCNLCEKSFFDKGNLNKHIIIHTGLKPFSCYLCDKRFFEKSNLNKHMRIHTGQKPFSCDLCKQKFSQKGHLSTHMRIHTEEKPFSCDLCEQGFARKDHLKTHMIKHTGQKPFSCDLCKHRFSEKGSLKKHMRIHTGQKPFSCDLCERRFPLKYHLNTHMRTHTGEKPFCCDLCGQRFSRMSSLRRHMRIHTGGKN
ncbi:zinc finger and SCAN domain-containing protein 12-like [Nematolebias whitei]|uniref:zinc finger and SCAN domain-containing protein 12-like n=1 Tax=Nematolebias whitei TaxID=451745 RepID=UPI001898F187|nr:zinc finger and SCAN domain-containing protein 12-like [Nematolebias whitei]